jgi:hypothetical protein
MPGIWKTRKIPAFAKRNSCMTELCSVSTTDLARCIQAGSESLSGPEKESRNSKEQNSANKGSFVRAHASTSHIDLPGRIKPSPQILDSERGKKKFCFVFSGARTSKTFIFRGVLRAVPHPYPKLHPSNHSAENKTFFQNSAPKDPY